MKQYFIPSLNTEAINVGLNFFGQSDSHRDALLVTVLTTVNFGVDLPVFLSKLYFSPISGGDS